MGVSQNPHFLKHKISTLYGYFALVPDMEVQGMPEADARAGSRGDHRIAPRSRPWGRVRLVGGTVDSGSCVGRGDHTLD